MTPGSSSVGDDDGLHPGKSTAIPYIPAQQQASSNTSSHQERALRYFSMTQSGDSGHLEPELNSSPLLPKSQERVGAPPAATSFTGHREQGELVEELREEGDRERQQGGAREEGQGGSIKGKLHSPDRDRDGRQQQQHPQLQHSAELSLWKGESEPLPGWRAADGDSQESRERAEGGGRGRGRGGYLREAAATHSSFTQEQERSSGGNQAGISGRSLH